MTIIIIIIMIIQSAFITLELVGGTLVTGALKMASSHSETLLNSIYNQSYEVAFYQSSQTAATLVAG